MKMLNPDELLKAFKDSVDAEITIVSESATGIGGKTMSYNPFSGMFTVECHFHKKRLYREISFDSMKDAYDQYIYFRM
tara:strand:- start:39397 stop:39630 length:234 start_codon:yes stop_codon:yes gene_type:complete